MNEIPGINKEEFGFEGRIKVEAWSGFLSRLLDSAEISDGSCTLFVGGDMVVDEPKIEDFHLSAYKYLMDNQEEIKGILLGYLIKVYPDLQEQYGYDEDEKAEFMSDVSSTEGFKKLIKLSNIHLMNVEKDGTAYVGYEFACKWDEGHGIGFMTHKNRIIDFGGADTSFLTWVAQKDLKTDNDSDQIELNKAVNPSETNNKPWWKFW